VFYSAVSGTLLADGTEHYKDLLNTVSIMPSDTQEVH